MKKIRVIAVFMVLTMVIGLVGCGGKTETAEQVSEPEVNETVAEPEEEPEVAEPKEAEEETAEEEEPTEGLGVNMIKNGDFTSGIENWTTYINHGGSADFREENETAVVEINNPGAVDYGVQIYYDGFKLDQGGVYQFSFEMSSTVERTLEARLQVNGGDYHAYFGDYIEVGPDMKEYSWEFTMEEETDVAPRLCFNMGIPAGVSAIDAHTVTFDNVSVVLVDDSNVIKSEVVDLSRNINVNQVGFLPDARKTAVVRSEDIDKTFTLIDTAGKEVYSGTLTGPVDAACAGEQVCRADFSDFTEKGTYTIKVSNGDESYPFEIADDVYDGLLMDAFKMLYMHRCGIEIPESDAGAFAHPVCHDTKAVLYGTNETKDVSGGWHDAGDYGRYVVSGVQTIEDLFLTYEDYPDLWVSDNLGIPESGNGIPDILDEARYELDWLFKMQDEKSGGVHHKVTCKEFPEFVMPQEETEELILCDISNTATGDFAAIMAKASTVYADIDPEMAKKALKCAEKAYTYLEEHKSSPSFKNPEDILTGEYPDGQFKDEMYWAAIELYKVTGDDRYKAYFEDILDQYVLHGFGWSSVGSFGNIAYLTMDPKMQDEKYVTVITDAICAKAEEYLNNSKTDGYMVALGDNYCWGSNLSVCSYARQMMLAKDLKNVSDYDNAIYDQLSYILGQNALSYCFVTGYGTLSPVNTHHRPSIAVGEEMPGMVAGGPDGNLEDSFIKTTMADTPPAKCYADNAQSFSSNEVTIYWNSPFVYLLSSIMN